MSQQFQQHDPAANGPAADQILEPLKRQSFDPVDYLNDILPVMTLSNQAQTSKASRPGQMQTVSSEVQALLSKLNTHNIRSTSELTSLTEEILRSGNRLGYEVEILRGDINSFHELLTDTLREDIQHFLHDESVVRGDSGEIAFTGDSQELDKEYPNFITQLRILGQVKARLESVVAVFGEALKWPIPPSDLSIANSLISVSAPELGVQSTKDDDKARESAQNIRRDVQDLLDSDGGGQLGFEAATIRVEHYKDLASIWKGTAEERLRTRLVESLVKQLDDRKRLLDSRNITSRSQTGSTQRTSSTQGRTMKQDAGGLFKNLARLKDDLYLE